MAGPVVQQFVVAALADLAEIPDTDLTADDQRAIGEVESALRQLIGGVRD